MSDKWHRFRSKYSPVVPVKEINTGNSNAQLDWVRLANDDATINGEPVKKYKNDYNQFETGKNVEQFFTEVILGHMTCNTNKEDVAQYLMTAFHQGGINVPRLSIIVFNAF